MQDLLGELVDLSALNLSNAMESTLDNESIDSGNVLDSTLNTTNNNNNDYGAGYVVIIQHLMELEKKHKKDSAQLSDIKNMLVDVCHSVSNLTRLVGVLVDENILLKDKLQQVYETQNSVLTTTRNATTNISDIVETESPSSTHTTQVSSTVPACVIYSMWANNYPSYDIEVDFEYLKKVCSSVFPTLTPSVKSALGIKLRVHIDNCKDGNVNAGDQIMMVLCSQSDTVCSDGRRAIVETLKLLGTTYAFMIPRRLAMLLSRTMTMDGGRILVQKDCRTKDMVGLGEGFDVISFNLIDQAKVRKCLARLHETKPSKATLRKFIKCIQTGTITKDGGMLVDSSGKKLKALFNDDVTNSQQSSSSLVPSNASTKAPAKSKFAALKKTRNE